MMIVENLYNGISIYTKLAFNNLKMIRNDIRSFSANQTLAFKGVSTRRSRGL